MENLKVLGEGPLPRFGHTITLVSKTKAVLFGGATGNTETYSTTSDTFIFDCTNRKWTKIEPTGSPPTPRAAHASTTVELNQLVIYGGAKGGGGLVSDDLYLLDLRSGEEHAQWIVVPVVGTTPGRRYGHSIAFSKPYLIVFGGNTGNESANDVWVLNVEKAPLFWSKLECDGDQPPARVYHSAALCSTGTANGMMVIFGGRTTDQAAINDTWGLRRHRNGTWDWVRAPYKPHGEPPVGRYQHSTLFMGSYMLVVGGRTNNVGENVPLEVYDTESSDWLRFPPVQRFRHSCWLIDNFLYVHGGFEQHSPNIPTKSIIKLDINKFFLGQGGNFKLEDNSLSVSFAGDKTASIGRFEGTVSVMNKEMALEEKGNAFNPEIIGGRVNKPKPSSSYQKNVRISDTVVVAVAHNAEDDREKIMKNVSIDKLLEEPKKLRQGVNYKDSGMYTNNKLIYQESVYAPFINALLKPYKQWNPPQGQDNKFMFKKDQVIKLIDEATHLFANSPDISTVVTMRIPVKIYGSLHGQYGDLLRLFDHWGGPTEYGDIEGFDYLFLGNYVDRGRYSLEVLCLLLSLKLKYPEQLHLVRGSHEDIKINKNFGFGEECALRLGEDINDMGSVFQRFNRLFEYLPLAAVIQDRILCVHSGIGSTIRSVEELESIPRPIEIVHEPAKREQQIVLDIFWSDPVTESSNSELSQNKQAYGIKNAVKFDSDHLKEFMKENGLSMLVRSHECVADGFERIWGGSLTTVFSATDYCGKNSNAAAVMVFKKNLEVIPKVIYPLSSAGIMNQYGGTMEEEKAPESGGFKGLGGSKMGGYNGLGGSTYSNPNNPHWIDNDETLKKRPATPPRLNSKGNFKKP